MRLFNQGMINKDGAKMSKSKGNVVSPDDLVSDYGCDSLRMYELFVGPPEVDSEWDDSGIDGVFRYLNRVWKLVYNYKDKIIPETKEIEFIRNKMAFEITGRLEALTMNTVVSGFMEYTNKLIDEAKKNDGMSREAFETLIVLLAPFTPHLAEELWRELGHTDSVFVQKWVEWDESKLVMNTKEIPVQLNGKTRCNITISAGEEKDSVLEKAKMELGSRLEGLNIIKEIYVPEKIVNIVAK